MLTNPQSVRLPTSQARDRFSEIIHFVQDPRSSCILTRHGKAVAAVVSMTELRRLHKLHDAEDITDHGHRPVSFTLGKELHLTNAEAAEHVQRIQLDRRIEREVLAKAGLEPVPGGELMEEMEVEREVEADRQVRRRRWWWFW